MPKLSKQFHLEITVEQFLNACSYIELQEVDLLLDGYLKKAKHNAQREAYRHGRDPEEVESVEAEEVGSALDPIHPMEGIQSIIQRAINTHDVTQDPPKLDFNEDF